MKNKELKIKIFNVGHGDCILITFPNGELGLIDSELAGEEKQCPALEEIIKKGHLKFLCLTHPHYDHFRGMHEILSNKNIKVDTFYHTISSGIDKVIQFYNKFMVPNNYGAEFVSEYHKLEAKEKYDELDKIYSNVRDRGGRFRIHLSAIKDIGPIAGVYIKAISPTDHRFNNYEEKITNVFTSSAKQKKKVEVSHEWANEISAVLHLEYSGVKILLAGDALETNWRDMYELANEENNLFPVDVLKASHHGATNSFYDGMWEHILKGDAKILVSCGRSYHPSNKFIKSLSKSKYTWFCTNSGKYCKSHFQKNSYELISDEPELEEESIADRTCCDDIEVIIQPDDTEPIKVRTLGGLKYSCKAAFNEISI